MRGVPVQVRGRGRAAVGTSGMEKFAGVVEFADLREAGRVCRLVSVGLRRELAFVWNEVVRAQAFQELVPWALASCRAQ